ncbi:hypothetical protein GIB67_035192, partial [Kingdonia uniflora]
DSEDSEAEPTAAGQAAASRPAATTVPAASTAASTGSAPHDIASLYTYMESQFGHMNSQFQLFCEDIGRFQTSVDDLSSVVQDSSSDKQSDVTLIHLVHFRVTILCCFFIFVCFSLSYLHGAYILFW